jgi:hypothetical protein
MKHAVPNLFEKNGDVDPFFGSYWLRGGVPRVCGTSGGVLVLVVVGVVGILAILHCRYPIIVSINVIAVIVVVAVVVSRALAVGSSLCTP